MTTELHKVPEQHSAMVAPIIRILGGPATTVQQNLLQRQPCSVHQLSHLTDVDDADMIVLWLADSVAALPEEKASWGDALSSDLRREVREAVQHAWANYRECCAAPTNEAISKMSQEEYELEVLNRPYRSPPSKLPTHLLEKVFDEFMERVWTAVRGGAMAFIVIPPKMRATARFNGPFTVEHVISGLTIDANTTHRRPDMYAGMPTTGDAVRRMVARLSDLIPEWPHLMGLRIGTRSNPEVYGETACRHLCPRYTVKDSVRFFPSYVTRNDRACSLLLLHGRGAVFIIPPPRHLDELLQSFSLIWKAVPPRQDSRAARINTISAIGKIDDHDYAFVLQEEGKWRIRFRLDDAHVETAEVKNTTGMRYLVALIEHPNERIYPEYLKSGYAKKHEQMVWVSEQTPAAEMAQGVKTGIDVEASTMRPRLRLTSGSATSQIERMNQELRGVVRQISDLDRAGLGIRDPAMAELIAVRKKIEKAIATMKRYREVNRHVKSVGKAISRALRLLQDQGCAELSTHLRAFIAPLEAEILSYEPPPEIRWNVFWTTNVPSRKARVRR